MPAFLENAGKNAGISRKMPEFMGVKMTAFSEMPAKMPAEMGAFLDNAGISQKRRHSLQMAWK